MPKVNYIFMLNSYSVYERNGLRNYGLISNPRQAEIYEDRQTILSKHIASLTDSDFLTIDYFDLRTFMEKVLLILGVPSMGPGQCLLNDRSLYDLYNIP